MNMVGFALYLVLLNSPLDDMFCGIHLLISVDMRVGPIGRIYLDVILHQLPQVWMPRLNRRNR